MKKNVFCCMAAISLFVFCSCAAYPPKPQGPQTTMQILPADVNQEPFDRAVEEAAAKDRAKFSLEFGTQGSIGAQGIDGRAGFSMEYDSGSWAIGIEGPIPIGYPGSR